MKNIKDFKMYKGCLIIVDMVNGFIKEGLMHDESIERIVPRILELIKEAKEEGKLIVFVKDSHTKDSIEFLRYGGKEHCLKNTTEALLIRVLEELEKAEDTISIEKNSTNFMESHQMRELMENQTEMEEFDIVGCLTDICVMNGAIGLTTYLDERNRKNQVWIHEDAVSTYAEENRKEYVQATKLLLEAQGIQFVKRK